MCLVHMYLDSGQRWGICFLDEVTCYIGPRGEVAFVDCFYYCLIHQAEEREVVPLVQLWCFSLCHEVVS